jgi:transketolase N-terminal domain/subunit
LLVRLNNSEELELNRKAVTIRKHILCMIKASHAGHIGGALSAADMLTEKGFFDASILDTCGSLGSKLPGHPNMFYLPGIETNTGALGHVLAIGSSGKPSRAKSPSSRPSHPSLRPVPMRCSATTLDTCNRMSR